MSYSAAVFLGKSRATVQVLKHIVNRGLRAEGGWRRLGEAGSTAEVESKYLLKIYLTAIHLLLFLCHFLSSWLALSQSG